MKFNGTEKQNKWANDILESANLTGEQIDNLLRYAGPTMHKQEIMDVTIVIENRNRLATYANSLGEFYKLPKEGKRGVAEAACNAVREIAGSHTK